MTYLCMSPSCPRLVVSGSHKPLGKLTTQVTRAEAGSAKAEPSGGTLSDRAITEAAQLLRRVGVDTAEPRISLALSVGELAARKIEKGIQSAISEATKYTTGARREGQPRSWEEALMAVPNLETIPYVVVERLNGLEIRQVESYLVAETSMTSGDRGFDFVGSGQAFNVLADYLFGKNVSREGMEMTTPVIQTRQGGVEMEMTTPVVNTKGSRDNWSMAFVIPSKFDESNIPEPQDPSVTIRRVPSKLAAVTTFSGFVTDDEVGRRGQELRQKVSSSNSYAAKPGAEVEVAQYNPPFTLPFMRRNEISLEIVAL